MGARPTHAALACLLCMGIGPTAWSQEAPGGLPPSIANPPEPPSHGDPEGIEPSPPASPVDPETAAQKAAAKKASSTGDDLPDVEDEEDEDATAEVPRAFGIGLTAVREYGYGVVGHWRSGAWGADLAAALALYSLDSGEGDPCEETVVNAPFRATAAGLYYFTDAGRSAQHAIKMGGLYDVEFGPGAMAGYQLEVSVSRTVTFNLGAGLQWMPDAKEQARQVLRKTCNGQAFAQPDTFDIEFRPYVGLGLTLYVF